MARGKSLDEVIADTEKIVRVWEANPTFSLGEVTQAAFRAKLEGLRVLRGQTEEARRQLTNLSNRTGAAADELNALYTRALSGVRAVFGPDSTQYEEAGGTRASDRRTRKSGQKGGGET
jgi:hypothetical protein